MMQSPCTTSRCEDTRTRNWLPSVSVRGELMVTQDRDFSNIVAFPPEEYPGIIVFRLHDPSRPSILAAMRRLIPLLAPQPLSGSLWTVDDAGIRIRPGGQP